MAQRRRQTKQRTSKVAKGADLFAGVSEAGSKGCAITARPECASVASESGRVDAVKGVDTDGSPFPEIAETPDPE